MCLYIYDLLFTRKTKKKQKKWLPRVPGHLALGEGYIKKKGRGLPRVPVHLALGEGYFFKKNKGGFPECLGMGTRGRGFEKK
jgi:hypothetical protein